MPVTPQMIDEFNRFVDLATTIMKEIHTDPELHRGLRVKELQPVWERLHLLALFGLNNVSAGNLPESGEEVVFEILDRSFPERPLTILDVGANVGDYTALALERLGSRVTVHSFEPLPTNFERLSRRFAGESRVVLNRKALGREPGVLPFYVDGEESTIGSIVPRSLEHERKSMEARVEVPVGTVDDYCAERGVAGIDLLKVDVEGADLHTLMGARRLLSSGLVAMVQFEFSGAQIDARHFFKDFWKLLSPRYSLYRILTNGLYAVPEYNERYEVFWCTNYLAVLRS